MEVLYCMYVGQFLIEKVVNGLKWVFKESSRNSVLGPGNHPYDISNIEEKLAKLCGGFAPFYLLFV